MIGNKRRSNRGFTLLEVIVGLTVSAMIAAAAYQTFSIIVKSREIANQSGTEVRAARLVLSRMTREIESSFIVLRTDEEKASLNEPPTFFRGEEEKISGVAADSLTFSSFAHFRRGGGRPETDQTRIYYFGEKEEGGRTITLKRWETGRPVLGEEQIRPRDVREQAVSLVEGLGGFELEYLEAEDEWEKEWDSTDIETSDQLPLAVRIRLSFPMKNDPKEKRTFETTALLRLPPINRFRGAGEVEPEPEDGQGNGGEGEGGENEEGEDGEKGGRDTPVRGGH